MNNRLPAAERYQRDAQFARLVDTLYLMMTSLDMTPTEVREAAMFAAIKFETLHVRPLFVTPDGHVEYGQRTTLEER